MNFRSARILVQDHHIYQTTQKDNRSIDFIVTMRLSNAAMLVYAVDILAWNENDIVLRVLSYFKTYE